MHDSRANSRGLCAGSRFWLSDTVDNLHGSRSVRSSTSDQYDHPRWQYASQVTAPHLRYGKHSRDRIRSSHQSARHSWRVTDRLRSRRGIRGTWRDVNSLGSAIFSPANFVSSIHNHTHRANLWLRNCSGNWHGADPKFTRSDSYALDFLSDHLRDCSNKFGRWLRKDGLTFR
jgi:hypothetical protein